MHVSRAAQLIKTHSVKTEPDPFVEAYAELPGWGKFVRILRAIIEAEKDYGLPIMRRGTFRGNFEAIFAKIMLPSAGFAMKCGKLGIRT